METFSTAFRQLFSFYESLTPVRKAALVFVSMLVVTVMLVMGMWANEGEYVVTGIVIRAVVLRIVFND